jgi:hypothetical protein
VSEGVSGKCLRGCLESVWDLFGTYPESVPEVSEKCLGSV